MNDHETWVPAEYANTLTLFDASKKRQTHLIEDERGLRVPTPEEWERLSGIPVGYTDVFYRGKPASKGKRYGVLGNTFCPPILRWIGEGIKAQA